jgi:hypothetical protein
MRYRNHEDDDERILKDGERLRVPLTMMDGLSPMQRAIARDSVQVTDGDGQRGIALNRPGFRMLAGDARRSRTVKRDPRGRIISTAETEEEEDARDAAYREHEEYLNDSWKHPVGLETKDAEQHDTDTERRTADAAMRARDKAYADYDAELREAWRGGK